MNQDKPPAMPNNPILPGRDFLEFLKKNGGPQLAKLEVRTKSGGTISRTFDSSDGQEVFKSLDLLKELFPVAVGGSITTTPKPDFTSRDWVVDYVEHHEDVPYNSRFFDRSGSEWKNSSTTDAASQRSENATETKKTDWDGLYENGLRYHLSTLVEAANRAEPEPIDAPEPTTAPSAPPDAKPKSEKKKKPRKLVPEQKEYVDEYTEQDVLFGRGGRSNHHPGNKMYRDLVASKQDFYRNCDKNMKTNVAQSIVDAVKANQKGRFLEKDTDMKRYYIVPPVTARRKVGQALRENNTEEARAEKRRKYGKKNDGKTSTNASDTSSAPSTVAPVV